MPPGGATTRQSPRSQTTSTRVTASTVVPLLPGPSVTMAAVAGRGVADQPVGGLDGVTAAGRLPGRDVGRGAQGGVIAVVRGEQRGGGRADHWWRIVGR